MPEPARQTARKHAAQPKARDQRGQKKARVRGIPVHLLLNDKGSGGYERIHGGRGASPNDCIGPKGSRFQYLRIVLQHFGQSVCGPGSCFRQEHPGEKQVQRTKANRTANIDLQPSISAMTKPMIGATAGPSTTKRFISTIRFATWS